MKSVIIIGASGHGKVVADIILKSNDKVYGFLDDSEELRDTFCGFPVLGKIDKYTKYLDDCEFIIAIGNANIREKIAGKLNDIKWYTAIHPTAAISNIDVFIQEGTTIMANTVINSSTSIGKHCIINTSSVVEHDNTIADYAHISVGAKLAGNVYIGKKTWVGIGATIKNNISICDNCVIGAGAVVVDQIEMKGTYIGVPAKKIL